MQQATSQNQTPVSKTLMIELFSRFFTRLLEKEEKFPVFEKEWEDFKQLLSADPLDLDSIFIHLASIQLHMTKSHTNPGTEPMQFLTVKNEKNVYQKTRLPGRPRPSLNYGPDTHSTFPNLALGGEEEKPNLPISIQATMLLSENMTDFNELGLVHTRSNDNFEPSKFFEGHFVPEHSKTKYEMSFLASKARVLRDNCHFHSHNLLQKLTHGAKAAAAVDLAERTPLRRVVVYSARQNNEQGGENNPQTHLYAALQDLAAQLEINPNVHPFNKALITH